MSNETRFSLVLTAFSGEIGGQQVQVTGQGLNAQIALVAAQTACQLAATGYIVSVSGLRLKAYERHAQRGEILLGVLLDTRHRDGNWLAIVLTADGQVRMKGPGVSADFMRDRDTNTSSLRVSGEAATAQVSVDEEQKRINVEFPVQQELAAAFSQFFPQQYITQAVMAALAAQGKQVTVEEQVGEDGKRQMLVVGRN